ncbi:hypothetical protein Slin15195_G072300 [Septoria linicola]|uniref:Uncharacterized protein n=1 Tax=Septoria linicola TaxID=215465 RepID=A0A9Q9EJM0_9PEZI|nr:hypothetical protein Slin14017_G105050 [Septoria linicola]USW53911.1 hypothetical protein Slin15195_G072300 [Septoria linicola]
MSKTSPFLLKADDVDTLAHSDGFQILRLHLRDHYSYELCDRHIPADTEELERWVITRDVLHALLVPVVELFDRACGVASAITHATKLEDLEYAFTGQSRSAFVWLQCFLSAERERDWCYTRGCPACVVEHSLDSEFTIRLLYAACLLSDVHYPFTIEGPTLPSFMFFLDSVQTAVEEDELFGEGFLELMQPKAAVTRDGIEELIHQCLELDVVLSQPSSPDATSPAPSLPASPVVGPCGGTPGIKIKRSRMARKQMSLQREEAEWVEAMMQQVWETLQPVVEAGSIPGQSLDAMLKVEPAVVVNEWAPE